MMGLKEGLIPASFRDPDGFLFIRNGILYRQIQPSYRSSYAAACQSGLLQDLIRSGFLIPHEEVGIENAFFPGAWKVIRPEVIPFISYPYEWCFSQLKTAALATLAIQKKALEKNMSLKDASAYNIQFKNGKPIFIDALSFEIYEEGKPWAAYRQFCEQFLAPLALMSLHDARMNGLLLSHPDGIPLDLASRLLPCSTWLRPGLLLNLHLHAKSQRQNFNQPQNRSSALLNKKSLFHLIGHLESVVQSLSFKNLKTEWSDYKHLESYSEHALVSKKESVSEFLGKTSGKQLWDLGANIGQFSTEAAKKYEFVLAADSDHAVVEKHWKILSTNGPQNILPLMLNLTHPSPAVGWENQNTLSLVERGPADTLVALALVHHIAITHNVPLDRFADYLGKLGNTLIIEFIPREDPQVTGMIANRKDIFACYTEEGFQRAFAGVFQILERRPIKDSRRILYRMQKTGR